MLLVLASYWKLFPLRNKITRFPGLPVANVRSVSSSTRLLASILYLKGIKTCITATESAAGFRIAQHKVTTALSLIRFYNRRPVEKVYILDDDSFKRVLTLLTFRRLTSTIVDVPHR